MDVGSKGRQEGQITSVSALSTWVGRDAEGAYRKSNRFGVGECASRKDGG